MAALVYQVFSSSAMVSMGLYHLISTTKNHLKSPRDYFAKPYHPFSSTPSSSTSFYQRLIGRNLQLYLIILCLLIAFFHQTLISSDSDPLLKGHTPVYRFTTLQSAAVLFLLLILSIVLLLSEITSLLPFPPDLFFGVASGIFFFQYSVSSSSSSLQISNLQAKCDSVSARIFHPLPGHAIPALNPGPAVMVAAKESRTDEMNAATTSPVQAEKQGGNLSRSSSSGSSSSDSGSSSSDSDIDSSSAYGSDAGHSPRT